MAARQICELPEDVLRQRAKRVSIIDKSIQRLINDMIETMHQSKGVAANRSISEGSRSQDA